jgi:triphosphoribosyl-dephospho-CoA synthase
MRAMTSARSETDIKAAFLAACHAELSALKPGNVHIHSAGHGMEVETFERAAKAAAPFIADATLKAGERILKATEASFGATGLNANLGIVLLCAPLAKAAGEITFDMGLRRRLALILSALDAADADAAFAAIRLANPAGLGTAEKGDVSGNPDRLTLTQAMYLAKDRDRIANAYVTAFADIFDVGLPAYTAALEICERSDLAVTTLHMTLLATFPDSHISRKWGHAAAIEVQEQARALSPLWQPGFSSKSFRELAEFDSQLKERKLNPGTTADFVVATIFTHALMRPKAR